MSKDLTLKDLRNRWECSKWTIYKYRTLGKLPAYKAGGLRFKEEDVRKFENSTYDGKAKVSLL